MDTHPIAGADIATSMLVMAEATVLQNGRKNARTTSTVEEPLDVQNE